VARNGKKTQTKSLWSAGGPGFSSATDDWQTPPAVFASLDAEFGFELDVCASDTNHKCAAYFTAAEDGLTKEWRGRVWLNPPYGRHGGGIAAWMAKALASSRAGATVVCLIPSRTDNAWWHESVMQAAEVRFVRGRLKFGDGRGNAPFASAIAVFRPGHSGPPVFSAVEAKILAAGSASQTTRSGARDDKKSMKSSRRASLAACPKKRTTKTSTASRRARS
jgi:phage N-6-adenine-methyltransferase